MVRVPTYASYMSMLNQTLNNKAMLDLYSFQATTGLKSPTYSGYGMSAYSIVNMEATLGVTSNFLENNKILSIELETMNTSMQAINDAVSDFKSMLNSFNGSDLANITPDYTGGEITFSSNTPADYIGRTITINGTQYTFTADDNTGNNISLDGLTEDDTYAEQVMARLKDKIDPTGAHPDFEFDGATFSFPLYTIDGSSSILNAPGVTHGEPHTMSNDQYENLKNLQSTAFSTMQMLADALNVSASGKYLFGGGSAVNAPVSFPFSSLEEFQAYYDGVNIKFPENSAANLSNREVTADKTGKLTVDKTGDNTFTITPENADGFLEPAVTANASTTGTLTFNSDKNTITATQYGAFNTLKAGDSIVINGGGDTHNGSLVVKSVSADGKTITFEDIPGHNITADDQIVDGGGLTISTSFPVGSVIEMDGFGSNFAPRVQVTEVNADGSLVVTADPGYFNADHIEIEASSKWSMSTHAYYKGGDLSTEQRISENQSITMDVTANDPAFEKLFRALGMIAQGNIVDTQDPSADFDGLIDADKAQEIITEATALLQSAVNSSGDPNTESNANLYEVSAKLNANYVTLNSNDENLTLVKTNLENSISSLKNVDQTEAVVKALMAANNLSASYSVLQNAMNISLLNYLD